MESPDASLDNSLSWNFYLMLLCTLLTILTRLNYASCFWQQIAIFQVELKPHKGQFLHGIWAEKFSANDVSTLKPPLCIISIPMKITWQFCFYLGTSFKDISCDRKDRQSQGEHFYFLRSGGSDLASSLEAKFGAMKPNKKETLEIQRQSLGYLLLKQYDQIVGKVWI